ncbi:hypothetical protein NFI96_025761, partial [Prochilodus magdalenae]
MTFAKSSFYRGKLEESASDPRKLLSIFSSPPPPSSLTPEDCFDRVNHKILLSVLTDLGITATAWNPSKTELLFVPSTASEDVSALTLVQAASELM